jgi:tRNA G18 (ribose-2'-O)-methylase SpoU
MEKGNIKKIVVLDNVRSIHNVGSIFRTSDALGIDKIYLCGCTPTPLDRFGRFRKDLAKVALGAEKNIVSEYCSSTAKIIKKLKKEGFKIIGVEQDKKSVILKDIKVNKSSVAIILGNEINGIDKKSLALCDFIMEIPMKGNKESLNVSVAFGIAGYKILEKYI